MKQVNLPKSWTAGRMPRGTPFSAGIPLFAVLRRNSMERRIIVETSAETSVEVHRCSACHMKCPLLDLETHGKI
ncbi:MAG: hypothetical protein IJT94_12450 [Oscillibacter sp.]|nr:hypothetical protein [Oscillibacter sp.]